ncbi:hypothetical protein ACFO0N_04105 [Halobium salinum]|uniref:Uncharacterized protein n=1 Tax=Halobium salinum TaxID=1364940 RepID=A0ABD5P8A4_9EURY|nr:hypothetical protein [Halobium salinum]
MPVRSTARFGVATVGLVALTLPLAVLLPADPVTTVGVRSMLVIGVSLVLAAGYARGRRSLRRLAAFIVVVQFLSMTLVPGFVLGYAALAALRSVPGGLVLLGLINRLVSVVRPVGTTVVVVSRYGLAYYVVYREGSEALTRWLPV